MAVADTHTVIWALLSPERLSPQAKEVFQQAQRRRLKMAVPSICLVEVTYLVEKGRLDAATRDFLLQALQDPESVVELVPLDFGVANALADVPRDQVPDMPDRIIAATAVHLGLPLVSRDRKIRASSVTTIW
jgi:PIN domain nuclease of toxin-antitoxin system